MQLGQREEGRAGRGRAGRGPQGGLVPFPQGRWEPWRAGCVWAQRGQDRTRCSQSFFFLLGPLGLAALWQLCREGGAPPPPLPPLRGVGWRSEVEGPPPFVPQLFGTHSDSSKEMTRGSVGAAAKPSLLPPSSAPRAVSKRGDNTRRGRAGHCPAQRHPHSQTAHAAHARWVCARILSRALPGSVATGTGCLLQEAASGWPEPTRPGSHSCWCSVLVYLLAFPQGSPFQRAT